MKVILVPVADRPECAKALDTAFNLGKHLDANVSGCHMRPHRYSDVSMSSAFADAAWRRKSTKKAPQDAKALYEKAAQQHDFAVVRRPRQNSSALWSEKVGSPSMLLGILGPAADMIVVSRPAKKGGVAELFQNAALLDSSTLTLILPQRGRTDIGNRVVIGWNQSPEVASTVRSSVALLALADEVTFVTCGAEDRPGPKAAQMATYLKSWGINARRVATRGDEVEKELLGAYKELGGDLLLCGAYSRSRWREKVFGGTTEYLLNKANVPVLTLHT